MTHAELHRIAELLNFEPLFYIIDKSLCRMMMVRKGDKYEYKGVWIQKGRKYIGDHPHWPTEIIPACVSKGHLLEYVTNYEFTKSREEADRLLESIRDNIPMTTEQMQHLHHDPNFHY